MRTGFSFLCCVLAGLAAAAGAPSSSLVSSTSQVSATAGGGSFQPVLSVDGRFVAFVSQANNLVTNDSLLPYLNVFLRDRLSGSLTLISADTNATGSGDDNSVGPSLSADGRFVAFESAAGNLATNDTNSASDVFLRDRLAGTTVLVSRERDGRTASRRASIASLLSTNGSRLVFQSEATNLVPNDTNGASDIFLFNRETGSLSLVSVNAAGNGSQAGASVSPAMSPDGQWVAFVNLSSNGTSSLPPLGHIYVRNLRTGTTIWASSNAAAQLPFYLGASSPVLSADGSGVCFHAYSATVTNLHRFDLASGASVLVSSSSQGLSAPSLSADGHSIAFERGGLVLVWDALTSNEVVASVTQLGEPAPSRESPARPTLSADGTKVTFLSNARDLTPVPTNGLAQLYQRDLSAKLTELLSADANGATSGDLSAAFPAVTPDGAVVAFESTSATMVPDDLNLASDVFVRDLPAEATLLISGRDASLPSAAAVALAILYPNSVSADGRYVAYASLDTSAFAGDTNGVQDLFVRDLATGDMEPISVSETGAFTNQLHSQNCVLSADGRHIAYVVAATGFPGHSSVLWRDLDVGETRVVSEAFGSGSPSLNSAPTISADGRWVAFETTRPTHLIEPGVGDPNSGTDIVLQDVLAGANTIISRNLAGTAVGNGPSFGPQFSPDGRWLAFASRATDLTTNSFGGARLFVRDLLEHRTFDISFGPYLGAPGLPATYAGKAVFSGDSRFLAYNAPSGFVGLYDLTARTLSNVCFQCKNPTFNGDGHLLAVETYSPMAGGYRVLLIDRAAGSASVIGTNVTSGAFGGAPTRNPVLGSDGRYLIFLAERRSDPPADWLPSPSLYLRDIPRGLTMPLPIDLWGGVGNGATYVPQLAADGRTLVFASFANNLVTGDFNSRRDVFAFKIGGPDIDRDGLDDDWEVAYFTDLSRDGTGDLDQDGHSDRTEFLTGTDPTNSGSVLSVMVVTTAPADIVTVIWNSVAGRTYDVQYKDALTDGWSTLFARVVAASSTRSVVDNLLPRPAHRFYRVVLAR